MSYRYDSALITSAHIFGDGGLGVLAENIPSTGDNGGSYLYNDLSFPDDNGKEICGRITTWPSAGDLFAYEDGSFEFTNAPDGSYSFLYQLYVDGVATGSPSTVTLLVGATNISLILSDCSHTHSAESLTLATASFIAVADALHAHAADNLTLDNSNATPLTTQDSTHAHSADNNALTLDTWLAIVEAVHVHSADNVSISSEELLAVADALHSHASDALVLSIPSPPGTCPTAAEIAAAILAAAQITPIYSDIRKVNNQTVDGTGTDGDPWGPL